MSVVTDTNTDQIALLFRKANLLSVAIRNTTAVQIGSIRLREKIKQFVKDYFRLLRPELSSGGILTNELDQLMQSLMTRSNAYTSTTIYKKLLENIRGQLGSLEAEREYKESELLTRNRTYGVQMATTPSNAILTTLDSTVPTAAISYRQAISNLQVQQISYRGTAAELREVLREVLDYLAPDRAVQSSAGFRLESGRTQPTMKQKVRFILRSRNRGATATEAPEEAASIVDEGIASLVRATYNRSSASTHTMGEGYSETSQIKRYLDSVLCELLEIH